MKLAKQLMSRMHLKVTVKVKEYTSNTSVNARMSKESGLDYVLSFVNIVNVLPSVAQVM